MISRSTETVHVQWRGLRAHVRTPRSSRPNAWRRFDGRRRRRQKKACYFGHRAIISPAVPASQRRAKIPSTNGRVGSRSFLRVLMRSSVEILVNCPTRHANTGCAAGRGDSLRHFLLTTACRMTRNLAAYPLALPTNTSIVSIAAYVNRILDDPRPWALSVGRLLLQQANEALALRDHRT
ncbi:hypothetical protein BDV35DRAFT_161523 [Aspergillus flavus]|uniref:Uncharacterized protein n=1 Tax=Aspergillus flavus TaxID=5059 RepID=A0A5N6GC16_ASPFL|nr:hypothetical protein BDV35DRAFT_161523 [Aspergillus flavus]